MSNLKKYIIKSLTFWIFPKLLKKQAIKHLQYLFGLSALKPTTLYEQYIYLHTKRHFIKQHQDIDIFAYRIVSLGTSCLSRTLPTQWGLKPRKSQGELTYPFDLSVNTLPSVVKYVANDFSDYFDDLYFDNDIKVWKNYTDGTIYNHDLDCLEHDKAKFINRFKRRINNFRYILMQDSRPAIFISHYNVDNSNISHSLDDAYRLYNNLYETIAIKRQNRAFKLVIVDLSGSLNTALLPSEIVLCTYSHLPSSYVWYQDEHRCSKAGLLFELNFAQTLIKLINQFRI